MRWFVLLLPLMVSHAPRVAQYAVFKGDLRVLEFSAEPGALISTSAPPPPPGAKVPPPHPFVRGAALVATEEGRLREILDASKNVDDFIARLRAAGYVVREDRAGKHP